MTKYREIIRLTGLGFSQRNIMASCGVAQKTVVKVQKRTNTRCQTLLNFYKRRNSDIRTIANQTNKC